MISTVSTGLALLCGPMTVKLPSAGGMDEINSGQFLSASEDIFILPGI